MTISDQMTKILGKHISNDDLHNEYDVYKAMQEFADQQSAQKETQLKDLHQQLSSLKASMDILVDDNERLRKRGMWVNAGKRLPKEAGELNKVIVKYNGNVCWGYKNFAEEPHMLLAIGTQLILTNNCYWLDESIISKGEEWISIDDKFPDDKQMVDTWNGITNRRAVFNKPDLFIRYVEPFSNERIYVTHFPDITHWRPLPIPPQGEEIKKPQ